MPMREQRVTPLELFFDLVFVYGITQVTLLMSDDPTWTGIGRGLLVLAALWWAWTGYAWLTNLLEPEEVAVRLGMFGGMAAMLVVALAVPGAFGATAALFGVAYVVVRLIQVLLYAKASKREPALAGLVLRKLPAAALASALILLAALFDGPAQAGLWIAALAVDYLSTLIGGGRGLRISPAHFAERYGLIVIIALGESIVAIGIAAAGVPLTAGIVTAAVLAIGAIAALWWAYFDVIAVNVQARLSDTSGVRQTRLARDLYSYIHLPMIAGIVLFALGLKKTIEQVDEPLDTVPAAALCGGLSLYFFSHVVLRIRVVYLLRRLTSERLPWVGPGRLGAGIGMLVVFPVALEVSALTALALVTGLSSALIVWDVLHYREERSQIREARP
jgi:low temperature requirement protein LtrA